MQFSKRNRNLPNLSWQKIMKVENISIIIYISTKYSLLDAQGKNLSGNSSIFHPCKAIAKQTAARAYYAHQAKNRNFFSLKQSQRE